MGCLTVYLTVFSYLPINRIITLSVKKFVSQRALYVTMCSTAFCYKQYFIAFYVKHCYIISIIKPTLLKADITDGVCDVHSANKKIETW